MNKIVVAVVVLVVVAAVAWYFLYGQGNDVSLTPASSGEQTTTTSGEAGGTEVQPTENTVSYTSNGFSPKTMTVAAGTTITFTSTSGAALWVASAPHPIHTDFPDFDAKGVQVSGENYSFTFTKAGSYGFHNHLKSSHKGTIVVE